MMPADKDAPMDMLEYPPSLVLGLTKYFLLGFTATILLLITNIPITFQRVIQLCRNGDADCYACHEYWLDKPYTMHDETLASL